MVNLLRLMGVEVQTADKEFAVKDQKFPAGSYVVRMDQPYSRMADMLLDTQYYNVNDPRPYDDTGWTLGAMRNVKTVRVADKSVLQRADDSADERREGDAAVSADGSAPVAYVINHNTDNTLATLRFKLKDVKMSAAEDSFKVGDQQFNAGSFIIKIDGNPADVRQRLEAAVTELGLDGDGRRQTARSEDARTGRSANRASFTRGRTLKTKVGIASSLIGCRFPTLTSRIR